MGCEPIAAEDGFNAVHGCKDWNAAHGFASSKELARDILEKVHLQSFLELISGYPMICV